MGWKSQKWTPFKKLILSMNTDNNGNITAEFEEGSYEAELEKHGLKKVCELTQNDRVLSLNRKSIGGNKS